MNDQSNLNVAFLDVGQGDSTVIILPDGRSAILVDCPEGQAPVVFDFLESHRIQVIEYAFITHSHFDHAGGMVDLINRFRSEGGEARYLAYLHDQPVSDDKDERKKYRHLLRGLAKIGRRGTRLLYPIASDGTVKIGEVLLQVLHPTQADCSDALAMSNRDEARNDISVVLRIEYAGRRVLLGADVQGQGWSWIASRHTDLQADIFKFPHHGAWYDKGTLIPEILNRIRPGYVIISVGTRNNYNHPSENTFKELRKRSKILRFLCTQATFQCHSDFSCIREQIFSLLPSDSQFGFSQHDEKACPCAGTIFARISDSGIVVSPTTKEHALIIGRFNTPQCRL
ncbi:MBL fold metallo-hydrolase [bacterium]|nr:MBL fold metallo-hydrolase [bacterium]